MLIKFTPDLRMVLGLPSHEVNVESKEECFLIYAFVTLGLFLGLNERTDSVAIRFTLK
jgi:hypothetical protein